uniref:von Willebrand factor n=1 Tax=Sus scrofa TaxID=9823 RepID=K7GNN0_PIG
MVPVRLARVLLALALTLPGALCGEETLGKSSMARCSLFGSNFINTFDQSMYSFAGSCSYLLAGDCQKHSFSIIGDFQDGKRVGLSVYLGEFFDIHVFVNGTVLQGDQSISTPYASKGLYLESQAGYHTLSSEAYGFVARIDGSGNFQVLLSDRYFNKTCGLCGDFNIFSEDDFKTQEGTLTSDPYSFANSWALSSGEQHCQRAAPPSISCNISSEMQKGQTAPRAWSTGSACPPAPGPARACTSTKCVRSSAWMAAAALRDSSLTMAAAWRVLSVPACTLGSGTLQAPPSRETATLAFAETACGSAATRTVQGSVSSQDNPTSRASTTDTSPSAGSASTCWLVTARTTPSPSS